MYIIVVVAVIFVLYGIFKRKGLIKQVDLFNRLLYVEKNPEKYVEEVDKILRKFSQEKEKNINLIQKTTGLLFIGRFEEAINILLNDVNKIPPYWQHVYYHNLILSMYFNGDIDKANETLSDVEDVLEQYSKSESNKTAIEFIYAVSDFYNNKGEERKDFFAELTKEGRNDYRIAFGYYFLGKINEIQNNIEESKENLEQAKVFGRGSFIEKLADEKLQINLANSITDTKEDDSEKENE